MNGATTPGDQPPSIEAAVGRLVEAGERAGLARTDVTNEAAAFVAAICAADPAAAGPWSTAFGLPVSDLGHEAAVGTSWLEGPTRGLTRLLDGADLTLARAYANALVDLAAAVGTVGDPSLECINAASFAASAQLRAVAAPTVGASPTDLLRTASSITRELLAGADPQPPLPTPQPGAAATTAPPAAATASGGTTPQSKPEPTLAELLAQLDALTGLTGVKEKVHQQAELLRMQQVRTSKGLKTPEVARHLVFVGNPGTGKTTVARLVGGIYRALGLLEHGTLIETDRSGLVAGYVGQTALKTADVVKTALGGVLFVDEAYGLAHDDFGAEAVDTLVKAMEDHREDLVLVVAGYPEKMAEFIESNPGLASRFPTTVAFDDYTDDELVTIFVELCNTSDFNPTDTCVEALRIALKSIVRDETFGNARFIRNLFEAAVVRQAWRLRDVAAPTVAQLRDLEDVDLSTAATSAPSPSPTAPAPS